jgi:hypothetical protein
MIETFLNEMTAAGYTLVSNAATFAEAPRDRRVLGFMDVKNVLSTERFWRS